MTARKKPTLAQRLAKRRNRVEHYDFPIADSAVIEERVSAVNRARQASVLASLGDDATSAGRKAVENAEAAEKAARSALDECFDRVEFRGLSTVEIDALLNELEERGERDESTFAIALLGRSCLDDSMGEKEWAEARETWPKAEWDACWAACDAANRQAGSAGIPKD